MKILKIFALLLTVTLLLACTGNYLPIQGFDAKMKEGRKITPNERHMKNSGTDVDNAMVMDFDDGVKLENVFGEGRSRGYELTNTISPRLDHIVYFKYDSSSVSEEAYEILESDAAYIGAHSDVTVHLAGHTDKRGSREYNLALGERRALSIRQILILYGASISQFKVVSFGEERLAVDSNDESVWEQNRRVEIKYVEY